MPRVDWSKYDELIGRMPDVEIARLAGVSHTAVQKRRKKITEAREAMRTGPLAEAALRLVAGRDFSTKIFSHNGVTLVAHEQHATEGYVSQQLARHDGKHSPPPLVDLTRDGRAMEYWRDVIMAAEASAEDYLRTLPTL